MPKGLMDTLFKKILPPAMGAIQGGMMGAPLGPLGIAGGAAMGAAPGLMADFSPAAPPPGATPPPKTPSFGAAPASFSASPEPATPGGGLSISAPGALPGGGGGAEGPSQDVLMQAIASAMQQAMSGGMGPAGGVSPFGQMGGGT